MGGVKTWFDNFDQQAKENNIQLNTELINSHRPTDYVILILRRETNIFDFMGFNSNFLI